MFGIEKDPRVIITTTPNTYNPRKDRWEWAVQSYYANGFIAYTTVHKGLFSRDIEVSALLQIPEIKLVKVLTWREAGKPISKFSIY